MSTTSPSTSAEAADALAGGGTPGGVGVPLSRLAVEQPLQANAAVLGGWYGLSGELGRVLHPDEEIPENATFPTFAAWSAETLRADMEAETENGGRRSPARRLYDSTARNLMGDESMIGRNFAAGEAMVYEEIGGAVRLFLDLVAGGVPSDPDAPDWGDWWDAYCKLVGQRTKELTAQRPDNPVVPGDAAELQGAMEPYFEVLARGLDRPDTAEGKKKRRAELILLGNVRLVAYEQVRVQPVLKRNMAFLPDAIRARIGTRLMGYNTPRAQLIGRAYRQIEAATKLFDEAFEIAATRYLYSLVVGDEKLRFGRDLPLTPAANPILRDRQPEQDQLRYASTEFFPYHLQQLDDGSTWRAWQQYDRSNGEGSFTRVDNWLRPYERLNFIVNLFRSRQQLSALYRPPKSTPPSLPPRSAGLAQVSSVSSVTNDRIAPQLA